MFRDPIKTHMSNFEFGKFIYSNDPTNTINRAKFIYNSAGIVQGGLFAAGLATAATAPIVEAAAPIIAVGSALYGVKQIYDGVKSLF